MIDLGLVNGEVWAAEHVDALEAAINAAQASADTAADSVGDRYGIRVTRAGNQAIPTATLTAIQWTAITWDEGGFDGLMTVPAVAVPMPDDGTPLYLITARLVGPAGWASDGANYAAAIFDTGDTLDYPCPLAPAQGANTRGPMWSVVKAVNNLSTMAVVITQVTGSDKNFTAEMIITRLSE